MNILSPKPHAIDHANHCISQIKEIDKTKICDEEYNDDDYYEYDEEDDKVINITEIPEITEIEFTNKETLHFKILDKYHKSLDKNKIKTMIDIIEKKSHISLRLLDWFVTKYANRYTIRYERNINDGDGHCLSFDKLFNVHISYKAQLKSYKKRYFDPFRRREKFKYYFDKDKTLLLCTTIGQLNFFKWAFTNGVINYVVNNYNSLAKSMILINKIDKSKKNNNNKNIKILNNNVDEITANKNGINVSANKLVKQGEVKIILSFN